MARRSRTLNVCVVQHKALLRRMKGCGNEGAAAEIDLAVCQGSWLGVSYRGRPIGREDQETGRADGDSATREKECGRQAEDRDCYSSACRPAG